MKFTLNCISNYIESLKNIHLLYFYSIVHFVSGSDFKSWSLDRKSIDFLTALYQPLSKILFSLPSSSNFQKESG